MSDWYVPADPTPREVCPCCDHVSLAERGHYLICQVCFWEDDGMDVDELDRHSGPNHITLREGRANIIAFGACEEKFVKNVCSSEERGHFLRKPRNVG